MARVVRPVARAGAGAGLWRGVACALEEGDGCGVAAGCHPRDGVHARAAGGGAGAGGLSRERVRDAMGRVLGRGGGRMRILYLSPDMSGYQGAGYQHDVMQELARQADVYFYGPGFSPYHAGDSLAQVVAKAGFVPDWIVCGHAWLEDRPGAPVERFGHIDLSGTDIPRAAILNKEYTNLAAKLQWIRGAGMSLLFTHHHDAAAYEARTGVR